MGLLAVPYEAAFGGVVVATTPDYLLRRGQIDEGLGGDILPLCYGFFTPIAFPWLLCLSLARSFTAPLSLEYWSGHPLLVSPEHLSLPSLQICSVILDMMIWDASRIYSWGVSLKRLPGPPIPRAHCFLYSVSYAVVET